MTNIIVSTDDGPRSSCCNAEIQCRKDYTDTHIYVIDKVYSDDNGKITEGTYRFVKTYDGIDGDNWEVTCTECDQPIDTGDIDLDES